MVSIRYDDGLLGKVRDLQTATTDKPMGKLPDGPPTPRWWQLIQWTVNPLNYLETCLRDYGEIFTARLGSQTWVIVNQPKAIQKILTGKEFEASGEAHRDLFAPMSGENSLLVLSGQQHKQRRQLVMPPFHGKMMHNYGQMICDIARDLSEQWKPGRPFRVGDFAQEIETHVILQIVFGLDGKPRLERIKQLLTEQFDLIGTTLGTMLVLVPFLQKNLGLWSPWGRIRKKQQQLDELLYYEIADRRVNPDPNRVNVLSLLISARDEDGVVMSDRELRDELLTFLVAARDSTSIALSWAFYWIHKLPEVKKKLMQELDSLPDNPDPMMIVKLPYLTAVCKETLRIYPPVLLTFARLSNIPLELMGYQLDSGVSILGSIYLTHRREDLYPEPKQFKPERFLEQQFSPYEFLPFGGGERGCIGMALAQFQLKLALATILSKAELTLVENQSVRPKRRSIVVGPDRRFQMVLKNWR